MHTRSVRSPEGTGTHHRPAAVQEDIDCRSRFCGQRRCTYYQVVLLYVKFELYAASAYLNQDLMIYTREKIVTSIENLKRFTYLP